MQKENFSKFGKTFQEKLACLILHDRPFSEQIEEVLETDFFEFEHIRIFSKIVFDYRKKYKTHPSYSTLETLLLTELENYTEAEREMVQEFFTNTISECEEKMDDADFIKDLALDFCKKRKVYEAMVKSIDHLENLNYDEIKVELENALKLGNDNNCGHDYKLDFEERYMMKSRNPVSTGWKLMDDITEGGLGKGELGVVIAATGCHAKGTKVMSASGDFINVEDVRVGDELMGPDSAPRHVMRLCRGTEKMYKIIPNKGKEFIVNGNHILSLKRTNRTNKEADNLRDQIVNISVFEYMKKSKTFKHLHKLYRPEFLEFKSRGKLEIDPYFVGIMLGGGSLIHHLILTTADSEILEESQKCVEKLFPEMQFNYNGKYGYRIVDLTQQKNPLKDLFEKEGLWGQESVNKHIPEKYKFSSIENRRKILAGLLDSDGDSDGHKSKDNCYDFVSKSRQLVEDVIFLSKSLGLYASLSEKEVGGTIYYRTHISGDCASLPIKLPRKQSCERKINKNPLVTGFRVEELGEDEYYGFTLDKDHLYIMEDFFVTHNSGKSMALVHLSAAAVAAGKTVVYYTLELDEGTVGLRHDAWMTGISLNHLKTYKDEVMPRVQDIEGELIVKYYPTKSASIATLERHLEKLKMLGKEPDLIIVDYGDLLKPTRVHKQKRMELSDIYEELRGLAGQWECPLYTASQTNRQGLNAEVVTMESISEAYAKCFCADFIFSISRTIEDKNKNTGRIFIAKNRNGVDATIYPIMMNPEYVKIRVLEPTGESIEEVIENVAKKQQARVSKKVANVWQQMNQKK